MLALGAGLDGLPRDFRHLVGGDEADNTARRRANIAAGLARLFDRRALVAIEFLLLGLDLTQARQRLPFPCLDAGGLLPRPFGGVPGETGALRVILPRRGDLFDVALGGLDLRQRRDETVGRAAPLKPLGDGLGVGLDILERLPDGAGRLRDVVDRPNRKRRGDARTGH